MPFLLLALGVLLQDHGHHTLGPVFIALACIGLAIITITAVVKNA